jgi:hypothetical protein
VQRVLRKNLYRVEGKEAARRPKIERGNLVARDGNQRGARTRTCCRWIEAVTPLGLLAVAIRWVLPIRFGEMTAHGLRA